MALTRSLTLEASADPAALTARARTAPVSRSYIQDAERQLGITEQNLRAGRLIAEAQAIVTVAAWYDNESGYATRLAETAAALAHD